MDLGTTNIKSFYEHSIKNSFARMRYVSEEICRIFAFAVTNAVLMVNLSEHKKLASRSYGSLFVYYFLKNSKDAKHIGLLF